MTSECAISFFASEFLRHFYIGKYRQISANILNLLDARRYHDIALSEIRSPHCAMFSRVSN